MKSIMNPQLAEFLTIGEEVTDPEEGMQHPQSSYDSPLNSP